MSMLDEKRAGELLALTTKVVQALGHSGQENLIVDVMEKFCSEHKFTDIHVDRYGNCIHHIKGSKPGPKFLFDGHMDTAPIPDKTEWECDPFGVEIVDGRMYGRRASDMKDALPAILAAALYCAEDANYGFPGDIYVASVVHEECLGGVATREVNVYAKPDYVIIGEASQLNMKTGQRSHAEIMVETFDVPVCFASPHKGVNAVYKMCKIIEEINRPTLPHHDVLGDGILELVDVKSSPYPGAFVVSDYCRAAYDRRLFADETKESVLAPLQELLDRMMKEDPQLKAKVSYAVGQEKCWTSETIEAECFLPGWLFGKNENWAQNIYKEMKEIDLNPTITNYDFYTNASYYVGEAGIRCVGVGPSPETLTHTINEYIETDQLNKVTESYYGVMKVLLK